MFFTVARAEAHRRLAACGLVLVMSLHEGTSELWRSADGTDVFPLPELDGTDSYEEEMIKAVEAAFRV